MRPLAPRRERRHRAGRALVRVAAVAAAMLGAAPAQAADAPIGTVEVTLDLPKDKPFVGEMIMLHMRSFIRAHVVLDEVRQPPMIDFDVQQMGRDKPIQAMIDGFDVDGIERDLAIFPDQAGRLNIPPFVRHVTIIEDGKRVERDFASKPVFVDVQNHPPLAPGDDWWLPAKTLTMTERFSPEPDEIEKGGLTRRTIVVEAAGLDADRLPPPPEVRAPGIITFRGPVKRDTILGEDGPTARATYVWDLRPATGAPARLPAVSLPWYDTVERRMRTATLPEHWIAYIGTLVHTRHEKLRGFGDEVLAPAPLAAGVAAFAWSAALLGFVATGRRRGPRRPRALSRLRGAARFNDEAAFRQSLVALSREAPERWGTVTRDPDVAARLAALDGALYAKAPGKPPPLVPLATDIERLWRAASSDPGRADRDLPALDARVMPRRDWRERLRR